MIQMRVHSAVEAEALRIQKGVLLDAVVIVLVLLVNTVLIHRFRQNQRETDPIETGDLRAGHQSLFSSFFVSRA